MLPETINSISTTNGLKDSAKTLSGDHEASNLNRSVATLKLAKLSLAKEYLETVSAPSTAQSNLPDESNRSLPSSIVPANNLTTYSGTSKENSSTTSPARTLSSIIGTKIKAFQFDWLRRSAAGNVKVRNITAIPETEDSFTISVATDRKNIYLSSIIKNHIETFPSIHDSTAQPYCTRMALPNSFPVPVKFYSYGIPLDQQRKDRDAIDTATAARLDTSSTYSSVSSTESDDSPPPYEEKSESSSSPSKKPRK